MFAQILIISIGVWGNIYTAEGRVEIAGKFIVCANNHPCHAKCRVEWDKDCPVCRNDIATYGLRKIVANPEDECPICLEKFGVPRSPGAAKPKSTLEKKDIEELKLPQLVMPEGNSKSSFNVPPYLGPRPFYSKNKNDGSSAFLVPGLVSRDFVLDDAPALRAVAVLPGVQSAVRDLIDLHLDAHEIRVGALRPREAVRRLRSWQVKERILQEQVKQQYLLEAAKNPKMEYLIFRADFSDSNKAKLATTVRQRRVDLIEEVAAVEYPGLSNYIGAALTKDNFMRILDDRVGS